MLTIMKDGDNLFGFTFGNIYSSLHPSLHSACFLLPDFRLALWLTLANGTFMTEMQPKAWKVFMWLGLYFHIFVITTRRTYNTRCIKVRRSWVGMKDPWSKVSPSTSIRISEALWARNKCLFLYGPEIFWLSVMQHYSDHSWLIHNLNIPK